MRGMRLRDLLPHFKRATLGGDVESDAHSAQPLSPHLALGQRGEAIAAEHLLRSGYRLAAANFKLPVGRNLRGAVVQAEIDIVAYEGQVLCFVEVKTRASDWFAAPEANVDLRKSNGKSPRRPRLPPRPRNRRRTLPHDVVSVVLPPPDEKERAAPRVELLRNAGRTRS